MNKTPIEKMIAGVGSVRSLLIHTLIFVGAVSLSALRIVSWDLMLLVLTTILSLEAIYLAIFIQMTVNRQAKELAEVSEDVEDIQEDIQEMSEDVGAIQKDVDEIQEDVEEIQEDVEEISEEPEAGRAEKPADVDQLISDVRRILASLEQLKK
jgi:uncharacterized protein YoxC